MPYRRYYITPTRLTRNPFLWRSIKLMVTLKPDQEVFLPGDTVDWLKAGTPNNWTIITTENASMCIEHSEYNLEYRWDYDVAASEKILDLLLLGKRRETALKNPLLREETMTLFIENTLPKLIEEEKTKRGVSPSSWSGLRETLDVMNITRTILGNRSCKTYQVQLLWNMLNTHSHNSLVSTIVDTCALDKLPDYIFYDVLHDILKNPGYKGSYYSSSREIDFVREGVRRNMISQNLPSAVVVNPQLRPTTFPPPTSKAGSVTTTPPTTTMASLMKPILVVAPIVPQVSST